MICIICEDAQITKDVRGTVDNKPSTSTSPSHLFSDLRVTPKLTTIVLDEASRRENIDDVQIGGLGLLFRQVRNRISKGRSLDPSPSRAEEHSAVVK